MCGIIGAIAQHSDVVPILLEGLHRLEYRGYDSAGLAVIEKGQLKRQRDVGRVKNLSARLNQSPLSGQLGIAHTRWATHGVPSEANAHPHVSHHFAIVHNGIIENYQILRQQLIQKGYHFTSETDTEVIVHLLHLNSLKYSNFMMAFQSTLAALKGAYALGVIYQGEPHRLYCAKKGSPLLIGIGEQGHFIASDIAALLPVTHRVIYLEDGDSAWLESNQFQLFNAQNQKIERHAHISALMSEQIELGTYQHFMQKEIYEQPWAIEQTIEAALTNGALAPQNFGFPDWDHLEKIETIQIVACGTSYHAALAARYWFEQIAKIHCVVEVASEYRYRESFAFPNGLFITISQSGETADTLAALKFAQTQGYTETLAICNVPESTLIRQSRYGYLTKAGPEIGVASTKAFSTQLVSLLLLVLLFAKAHHRLTPDDEKNYLNALEGLPQQLMAILKHEEAIKAWATHFADKHHALFLGRGIHYPIACEGALKLKEISYIHAEAYPAGELKHGPLALIDDTMPVIALVPNNHLAEKMSANLQEVHARGGTLYLITDQQNQLDLQPLHNCHILSLPLDGASIISPILYVIPLQLLAYHAALVKGTDVDKPRNLAKSVTVE